MEKTLIIRTLVVDPGKKEAGVALFENKNLVYCFLAKAEGPVELAYAIHAKVDSVFGKNKVDRVVCEGQQVYGRGGGNPNDLFPLSQCVGAVIALAKTADYEIILPRVWTKGVKKEARQKVFLESITAENTRKMIKQSCASKSKLHNVIDAVHLGYFYVDKHDL
jgi:hypothetical protein